MLLLAYRHIGGVKADKESGRRHGTEGLDLDPIRAAFQRCHTEPRVSWHGPRIVDESDASTRKEGQSTTFWAERG